MFENLKGYLDSNHPFFKRYALVMLLTHFIKLDGNLNKLKRPKVLTLNDLNWDLEGSYITKVLKLIDRPYEDRDASMAAAWLICEAFLFFPKTVLSFLKDNRLDKTTKRTALQKIQRTGRGG